MKSLFISALLWCIYLFILTLVTPSPASAQSNITEQVFHAEVTQVVDTQSSQYDPGQRIVSQELIVTFTNGPRKGESQTVTTNQMIGTNEPLYQEGDKVLINYSRDDTGFEAYYIIDFIRTSATFRYLLVFIVLVLYVGRWQGLRSLIGLAASFTIIFTILLPGIQRGWEPMLVTIISCSMIMGITFYISHGLNKKTTIALIGTGITLIITIILARLMVYDFKLTGYGSEEASFLQFIKGGDVNIQGLLLAGIIISVVGVLDDITISQTSVVTEIKKANPKLKASQVYSQAMNVGKDHIASLVNTLILVYVGAALPLTLLFMLDSNRSFSTVLSYSIIAEEVARTLVGSIALVLAVPITTYLATHWMKKEDVKKIKNNSHSHTH